ncbi:symporter [Corallococcus sp. H22C18031201]|uniref:symporter n=1 Tax=Citreicoccus inhibens TaxID=2849499 RepID=UPI000E744C2E|nr:symporter [Citreicoccus inhibens]MBU8896408.1 symporter [Citreicoccus inhibens]RJS24208.1 symporter [Corallococcus sp. H22C18031201]
MKELAHWVGLLLMPGFIVAMGLEQGLAWRLNDLGKGIQQPVYVRGMFVCLVWVPVWALLVTRVFPLHPMAGGVIALMAFCPGLPMALPTIARQKGNMPLGLALSITLTLAAIVLLPLSLALLGRLFPGAIESPPFRVLIGKALLPFLVSFIVGLALQRWDPPFAQRLQKPVAVFFKVTLSCAAVLLIIAGIPMLKHLQVWGVVAMLFVTLGSAFMGHFFGGPRDPDRVTLGISAVYGNPALAMCAAGTTYPMQRMLGVIGIYLIIRTLALVPYQVWNKRRREAGSNGQERTPSDPHGPRPVGI